MAKILNKDEIIAKASKGYIADYYASSSPTGKKKQNQLKPVEALNDLATLMLDSTFNTEVNVIADGVLKKNFRIVSRKDITQRDIDKELEFERKYKGFENTHYALLQLLIYRNFFQEVEYKRGKPYALHPLETTQMEINITPHGDVKGYTQVVTNTSISNNYAASQEVRFKPKECVHSTASRITTNPWGFVDNRSIAPIIEAKKRIENYLNDLFVNNKFRDVWNIQDATSEQQVKNFIESIRSGKYNPDKDIVVEGNITQKKLSDATDFQYFINLQEDYKSMIREFLRVPAIMVGGSTGKSDGEFQVRYAFDNTIKAWQRILTNHYTNKVFPLLGWGKHRLMFLNNDVPNEEKFISMAVNLKGLGYDDETIHSFLIGKGVEMPDKAKFVEIEEVEEEGSQEGDKILKQKQQNMNAESRKPRDKSSVDTNLNEDKETRDEQIVGKSNHMDFSGYPYVF